MLRRRTNFEVRIAFPFGSVSAVIYLVTLTLTLKLVRIIFRGMGNLSNGYQPILLFLGLFVLDLWANTLSDGPRDFVTMTFDFGGHGIACDAALHALTVYQV